MRQIPNENLLTSSSGLRVRAFAQTLVLAFVSCANLNAQAEVRAMTAEEVVGRPHFRQFAVGADGRHALLTVREADLAGGRYRDRVILCSLSEAEATVVHSFPDDVHRATFSPGGEEVVVARAAPVGEVKDRFEISRFVIREGALVPWVSVPASPEDLKWPARNRLFALLTFREEKVDRSSAGRKGGSTLSQPDPRAVQRILVFDASVSGALAHGAISVFEPGPLGAWAVAPGGGWMALVVRPGDSPLPDRDGPSMLRIEQVQDGPVPAVEISLDARWPIPVFSADAERLFLIPNDLAFLSSSIDPPSRREGITEFTKSGQKRIVFGNDVSQNRGIVKATAFLSHIVAVVGSGGRTRAVVFSQNGGAGEEKTIPLTGDPVLLDVGVAGTRVIFLASDAFGYSLHFADLDGSEWRAQKQVLRWPRRRPDLMVDAEPIFDEGGGQFLGRLFSPPTKDPKRRSGLFLVLCDDEFAIGQRDSNASPMGLVELALSNGIASLVARVPRSDHEPESSRGSPGREPGRGPSFEDLASAVRRVCAKNGLDPARIGVLEHGMGSVLFSLIRRSPSNPMARGLRISGALIDWSRQFWPSRIGITSRWDSYDDLSGLAGSEELALDFFHLRVLPRAMANSLAVLTITNARFGTQKDDAWEVIRRRMGTDPAKFVQILESEQEGEVELPSVRLAIVKAAESWLRSARLHPQSGAGEVPRGSELDHALAKRTYARSDGKFGVQAGSRLLPELVPFDGVLIGRFEVTRAQWASFHPEFELPRGQEDFPMSSVSEKQVESYLRKISSETGRPYRLLTFEEHRSLPRGSRENTLEGWFGFRILPEDVPRYRSLAAEGPSEFDLPPLLLAVGSRPPGMKDLSEDSLRFHDVGGNVAEWVRLPNGTMAVAGGSAFSLDDADGSVATPPAYVGFRVASSP